MQKEIGILGRKQRRWAWVLFVALAANAPLVAYALETRLVTYTLPRDSWLLSVVVAGLVAVVIIVDDAKRGRAGAMPPDQMATD